MFLALILADGHSASWRPPASLSLVLKAARRSPSGSTGNSMEFRELVRSAAQQLDCLRTCDRQEMAGAVRRWLRRGGGSTGTSHSSARLSVSTKAVVKNQLGE